MSPENEARLREVTTQLTLLEKERAGLLRSCTHPRRDSYTDMAGYTEETCRICGKEL